METDIRLVNAPFFPDGTSMRTGSFAKQWQETLDPAINRAAVHDKTALGEPLDKVGLTQAVADVPADRQGDDIIRKAMVRKGTG